MYNSECFQMIVALLIFGAFTLDICEAQVTWIFCTCLCGFLLHSMQVCLQTHTIFMQLLPAKGSESAETFFILDAVITVLFAIELMVNIFAHSNDGFHPFYSKGSNWCVCVCVCVYAHANVSVRACALVRIHITCSITACPSFACVLPFQVRRFNLHHFHRQRHNNSIRIQTAQCQAPSSSSSRTCDKTLQCSKRPQPAYHCNFICSGSRVQRLHYALHHRFVLPTRPLSCEDTSRRAKSNTYKCV